MRCVGTVYMEIAADADQFMTLSEINSIVGCFYCPHILSDRLCHEKHAAHSSSSAGRQESAGHAAQVEILDARVRVTCVHRLGH